MLSSLLEKLNVVQDGISSSFRGLSTGHPIPRHRPEYAAGCGLFARYHTSWQDLTNAAEYNANLANGVDQSVTALHDAVAKQKMIWSAFASDMTALDAVVTSTESIVNMIGKLRMDISEVEEDLIRLENLIETEEYYRKRENEKTKLNLYREQKLANLDKYRATLAMRHMEKMKTKEEEESFAKQVKTEVLEKRFARDMANYKTFGVIPEGQSEVGQGSSRLEEVDLEQDPDELKKYLED